MDDGEGAFEGCIMSVLSHPPLVGAFLFPSYNDVPVRIRHSVGQTSRDPLTDTPKEH